MQVLIKGMQPLAKKNDKNYDGVLNRALKPTSQAADKFTSPCRVQIQANKMGLVWNNWRSALLRFQGHDFHCFVLVLSAKAYLLGFPEYWKQMLAQLSWFVGAAGSSSWLGGCPYLPPLSEGAKAGSGKIKPSTFLTADRSFGLSSLPKWTPFVIPCAFLQDRTKLGCCWFVGKRGQNN